MTKYYLFFLILLFFLLSCKPNSAGENDKLEKPDKDNPIVIANPDAQPTNMANPAATLCVNDGYKLEPIIENGVTVEYFCVNPETGLKCEVWKYFRKECQLTPMQN